MKKKTKGDSFASTAVATAAAVAAVPTSRLLERIRRDRDWFRNLTTSLVVAGVSIAILLAYQWYDPEKAVEHYYLRENHVIAHRVMVGCGIVILASVAFNLRFVVFELAQTAMSSKWAPRAAR